MREGFSNRHNGEAFLFFALKYQFLVKEMRDALKKINVAKMCNSTNLNVIRIRNYMNGKIAHLRPEEEKTIRDYFNNLVNMEKRG